MSYTTFPVEDVVDAAPPDRVPASVSVVSALAQTTVSDAAFSVTSGAVTPYANPFAEAAEELLVVDRALRLTQVTRDPAGSGWVQRIVAASDDDPYEDVVVATHLDGTPWAFALTRSSRLQAFELQADSTWKPGPVHVLDFGNWTQLQVQYLRDRPTTAWLFARHGDGTHLRALSPLIPAQGDEDGPGWIEQTLPAPPELTADWVCGWETPEQGLAGPTPVLRLYVRSDSGTLTCHPFVDRAWAEPVTFAEDVDRVLSTWSGMNENLGVAFCQGTTIQLWSPSRTPEPMPPQAVRTDVTLQDPVVWQDARAMLHVYGLSGGELRVAHQTHWGDAVDGVVLPAFLSAPTSDSRTVTLTLPLRAGIDSFAIDAYPDTFPSQVVHRAAAPAEEAYSLLTQDTTTRWWSEEAIALTGGARRIVDRYLSTVTVSDMYGGPMPGTQVTLTAESRTQVEVGSGQATVTLGPGLRVPVTTDELGRITVRQVPAGLTLPSIHVDVPGVRGGVRIDPTSAVRAFLAGERPLPNHADGCTPVALRDAQVDGKWLVPGWHDPAATATLPTPDEIVTWCAQALSPVAPGQAGGWSLDLRPQRGPASPEHARLLRHGTVDELDAHLAALRARPTYRGVLPIPDSYLPDLWGAIAQGGLGVTEATVDPASQTASVFVSWPVDETTTDFEVVLSIAEDDGAAHFVEATFQWIGAGVGPLISWLSWGLGLDQVWQTATALKQGIAMLPALVNDLADHFLTNLPPHFFADHQGRLDYALNGVLTGVVSGSTLGSMQDMPVVEHVDQAVTPLLVGAQDALSNPHLDWLRQELDRIGGDTHADAPPTATPDDAWNALWATFSTTEQGSAFARAVDVMSGSVPAMLDPDDPATLARCRVDDILAPLSEGEALLQLSDVLSPDVLTAAKTLVGALTGWLDTPLIDGAEADLCRWLATSAGQPAPLAPTQGDLAVLQAAYPLTAFCLSTTGQAPFPDGTFPPLRPSEGEGQEQESNGLGGIPLWLIISVLRGSLEWNAMSRDQYLDYLAHAGAGHAETMRGFAVNRLVDGVLTILTLRETPWGENDRDDARWAEAGLEVFTALVEAYFAYRWGTSVNYYLLADGGGGLRFLSFLGIARISAAYMAWTLSPKTDISKYEAWSGIARAFSDATAFMRPLNPPLKLGLDLLSHLMGMGVAMFTSLIEWNYPLTITQVPDKTAGLGKPFSLQLEVSGGWPPYTFGVQGLPNGLTASSAGLISGTPGTAQTSTVTCQVTDGYTPPITAAMTFKIRVK